MEQKTSEFDKVLGAWDILVIAFGAMIGWGWVVSSGNWIESGGVLGAAIAFVIGGIMIFFVGLTYAELTAAMPQCGGEHVFSYRAMGSTGSFICTWAIILGYVSVACFEACAFPTIITYLWPGFLKGYLYTVAGFDVYASWLIVAIVIAFLIMIININGAKTAAVLQTVLTCIIGGAGIILIVASVVTGSVDNLQGQMFVGNGTGEAMKSIIKVAVITPFFFIGFDVIPQAAEEINVPLKKIGKMMILSVVLAVVFYALVILAVGYILNPAEIIESQQGTGLVTADAMAKAFGTKIMAKVIIVGGMCGIITSWNSFLLGGSRAMYSMAESYMIPPFFAKLHPKHITPVNSLYLIGALTMLAPFAGRTMMVWICDAGNCGANVDARPSHLVQFAKMGSIYMENVVGIKNPRVAIVNNGAEEEKGNALVKETFPLLKECKSINFIGSIEARDIPAGYADVVVCEAFVGNVILKLYEGVGSALVQKIKEGMMTSTRSKIGALLVKPALKETLKSFDATEYGGAPLLGLKGLVVKTHGSAKAIEIKHGIFQCVQFKQEKINEKIAERILEDQELLKSGAE